MRAKTTNSVKEDMVREKNHGSHFLALHDLSNMEEDVVSTNDWAKQGKGVDVAPKGSHPNPKGMETKKTLDSKEGEAGKVRVSVSHADMTSSMGSLDGLTTEVFTQGGQYVSGSVGEMNSKGYRK